MSRAVFEENEPKEQEQDTFISTQDDEIDWDTEGLIQASYVPALISLSTPGGRFVRDAP